MKIELLTSPTCPSCPMAKRVLGEYSKTNKLPLKEISTSSKEGKKWAEKYGVMSVPSFVIYGEKRPLLKTGAPTPKELTDMVLIADGKKEVKKNFIQKLFF